MKLKFNKFDLKNQIPPIKNNIISETKIYRKML